jgi:hypothetical protein
VFQYGPNKIPVVAILVMSVFSLVFICIGQLNTIAPVLTMPFMLTYAVVDYAYFALAMTLDQYRPAIPESRLERSCIEDSPKPCPGTGTGSTDNLVESGRRRTGCAVGDEGCGRFDDCKGDLDQLFPVERSQLGGRTRSKSLPDYQSGYHPDKQPDQHGAGSNTGRGDNKVLFIFVFFHLSVAQVSYNKTNKQN